jgi:hypothetical protein
MDANGDYKFLKPKRGSRYRQLFFGRIRAEVLYRETVGTEPLTAEEVAREYNVSGGCRSGGDRLLCPEQGPARRRAGARGP